MLDKHDRETFKEFRRDMPKPIRIKSLTIEDFVDLLETYPGFSFARISDGGFFCLQGRKGYNCDGVAYTSAQSSALLGVIRDPSIFHGITSIALNVAYAAEWLGAMQIDIQWYDADVMNKASDAGTLFPFIEYLRKHRSLVVGAAHLGNLNGFPIAAFVECHPSEAFEEVDELELEIGFRVARDDFDVVLLSAGQGASPTLVSRLHALHPQLTIIDTGSVWDPYVRVFSRSGHKKQGWDGYKKLGWKNFNMDIEQW